MLVFARPVKECGKNNLIDPITILIMKHIRYSRFLLCCILLCFLGKTGYSQVVVSADSTGCSSTSVTLHATIIGDVPTSSGITADDGWSGVIPIGFTFNF